MAEWSGRTVLVTGGGGFIGSHLVERLVELGAEARVLLRYTSAARRGWLDDSPIVDRITVFSGDLCDAGVVGRAMDGVDVVFHLAALIGIPYSYHAPASYVRTNIEGTLTVLEAARRAAVARVVHTSTSEVYGTAQTPSMTEAHPLQTQSPYAASKAAGDLLALAYVRSFGLEVAIARPFNVYGPRQSTRAVIPTIIAQAIAGTPIRLGHVAPRRDFTYVTDTVDALERIGRCDGVVGEVVNIGSGREISVADLAARIQEVVGTQLPIEVDPGRERPDASEVDRLCADSTKAHERLGWTPRVGLSDGLARTVDWMRGRSATSSLTGYAI